MQVKETVRSHLAHTDLMFVRWVKLLVRSQVVNEWVRSRLSLQRQFGAGCLVLLLERYISRHKRIVGSLKRTVWLLFNIFAWRLRSACSPVSG
jgi:hypothetical protein